MFMFQDVSGSDGLNPSPAETYAVDEFHAATGEAGLSGFHECEEVLIVDHRASLGPAQHVENKLSTLLGGALLPVSHVRMPALLGSRNHR